MVSSRGTRSRPFGLERVEAILATNLVEAIPTLAVIPSSCETRLRTSSPIWRGGPSLRMEPAMSRKASSTLSGSTSGVMDSKIAMMRADTWR